MKSNNKQFWYQYFRTKDPKKVPTRIEEFGWKDGDFTDRDIQALASRVAHIDTLILGGSFVTNTGIGYLTALQYIGRLHLKCLSINDECIPDLLQLTTITYLHIGHCNFSEEGIRKLKALPLLKELIFSLELVTSEKEAFYTGFFPHCDLTICGNKI